MDASGTAVASLDGAMAAHARVTQHRPATERGGRAPAVEPLFEQLVHDLRNPLGIIGYFAQVIPTAPAAERDELCERVRVNAQRALDVLEEFVLLVDLLVIVLAVLSASLLWVVSALALTLVVAGCWVGEAPAQLEMLPEELVVIGGFEIGRASCRERV
jgi:signal transduction histidine kinase